SNFTEALGLLGADDVSALHQRPEWAHYRNALADLNRQSEVVAAFQDYRRMIDEAVIHRLGSPNVNLQTIQMETGELLVDAQGGDIQQASVQYRMGEGRTGAREGGKRTATSGVAELVRNLFQPLAGVDLPRRPRGLEEEALRGYIRDAALEFLQTPGSRRVKSTTHVEANFHDMMVNVHAN